MSCSAPSPLSAPTNPSIAKPILNMPKAPLKSTATVVVPGQPSATILAALKAAGARVTTQHLADAIRHLERARVGFVVEAIATGILLSAKKESIGHQNWQPFLAEVWANLSNRKRVSELDGAALDNLTRSLRGYTFLARHFLADLEQGTFQPEAIDQKVTPPAIAPADVLALDTLTADKRTAVYGAIEQFVAGRSLRRMLTDFRRAEHAADQEEVEEANRKRKKKGPAVDVGQMDFFAEMTKPIAEIDNLFDSQSFIERTDKKFWLGLADKLDTQAARARALAKEIAS